MTSVAYGAEGSKAAFSGNFSNNFTTYSAISGLTSFTDRIALVLANTVTTDTYEQTYIAVPTNMLTLTIADLTADLNTYHTATYQEAETTQLFNTLKALKINRFLSKGTIVAESDGEEVSMHDVGAFVAHPSESEVRSPETLSYVYPTIVDGSTTFYYITPIADNDTEMEAKIDESTHSAIFLLGKNLDKDTESGYSSFHEYLYKSPLLPFEVSYGFDNYNLSNPAPIWIRANVQTDYRIKGIATIGGGLFDSNVHETLIVYDDDFKLSLNYKDATYDGAGSFSNITNGYIKANDATVLQKIQEKADALLEKYGVVQNSGTTELNGVQQYWKVGDWSNKFTGSGRDIETPVIVNSIVFDFKNKKTNLFFGNV